ncbi:hypothetical protein H6P81_009510 [Aristolochia fimbriata]|uniref:G domain-containing protein n=1 Tax=Aristolochia fimbriata TaxID=158543 RepID=A0AAV7EN54_ARIFI|nr:hypothetical protein H6P81_009510 [Aristolochia fimbriata]
MGGGSANGSSESLPLDTDGSADENSECLPLDIAAAESLLSSVNSDSEITLRREGDKSFEEFTRECPSIQSITPSLPYRNRRKRVRKKLLLNYQQTESRVELLKEAKFQLLNYRPGAWIEEVGGLRRTDYEIPKITTLLLVGPRSSGKSSLVNKISRVLEDGWFSVDRAQISDASSPGQGTYFLHEYTIPKESTSFCIYDTRSLSTSSEENFKVLKDWMINGVQHGQKITRSSDDKLTKNAIKLKARHAHSCHSLKRMVNFVIFVVDACSVLKSMVNNDTACLNFFSSTFNYPFLSFKDDKPAIVVTHGDELLPSDRAEVCSFLGDLLGIPPEQIFDIPDESDAMMELAVTNLLFFCLDRADRNLPVKRKSLLFKDFKFLLITVVLLLLLASLITQIARCPSPWASFFLGRHTVQPSANSISVEWSQIRHLWYSD